MSVSAHFVVKENVKKKNQFYIFCVEIKKSLTVEFAHRGGCHLVFPFFFSDSLLCFIFSFYLLMCEMHI